MPLMPSGRPVPPFKPPGLFARTSGLVTAVAAAMSNGDDVDELDDDDDDEFDDDDEDDEEEEDWDDEYEMDDNDDSAAAAAATAAQLPQVRNRIRYDRREFNVDLKAVYSA